MIPPCVIFLLSLSDAFAGRTDEGSWSCKGYKDTYLEQEKICDKIVQCFGPDKTDETEGCELFADSGCTSWKGREHYNCSRDGLLECFDKKSEAKKCQEGSDPPERKCDLIFGSGKHDGFRCRDGFCIENAKVCDLKKDCVDGTDESEEDHLGCKLFPWSEDFPDGERCISIGAEQYYECNPDKTICVEEDFLVKINNSDPSSCRRCPDPGQWRCDNGRCIDDSRRWGDLRFVCAGQREESGQFQVHRWYTILIISLVLVLVLPTLTIGFRNIHWKAILTRSKETQEPPESFPLTDKSTDFPTVMIELIETEDNYQTGADGTKTLKTEIAEKAKKEYFTIIRQHPLLYFHLYNYVYHRYENTKEMTRIIEYFYAWEKIIFEGKTEEIFKYWRLRLGSLSYRIIDSVSKKDLFDSTFCGHRILLNIGSLVFSFLGGLCYLLERLKNIVYIMIAYDVLYILSKGHPSSYEFELTLFITVIFSILLVVFINIYLSLFYTMKFVPENTSPWKKVLIRLTVVILSQFLPIFVLTNHVYDEFKTSSLKRQLQHNKQKEEKKILYEKVIEARDRCLQSRKIYSHFRVVGTLESLSVIICFPLLFLLSSRADGEVLKGLETEMMAFFQKEANNKALNFLVIIVIFVLSIVYGLLVTWTALVEYWRQSKNLRFSFRGPLSLYLLVLTSNRIICVLALIVSSPSYVGSGVLLSLLAARFQAVFVYKRWFSSGHQSWRDVKRWFSAGRSSHVWASCSPVDKLVNVLVNCVVVTPVLVQEQPVSTLQRIQTEFGGKRRERRSEDVEMGKDLEVGHLSSQIQNLWWSDPTTQLDSQTVLRKLNENNEQNLTQDDISPVIEHLVKWSLINFPMLCPVRTKREYFFLFIIVAVENCFALGFGCTLDSGEKIAFCLVLLLASFIMSIYFLVKFYREFFMESLTPNVGSVGNYLSILLCLTPEVPLKAVENEEALGELLSSTEPSVSLRRALAALREMRDAGELYGGTSDDGNPGVQRGDDECDGANLVVHGEPGQRPAGGGDLRHIPGLPGEIRVDEEGRVLLVLRLDQDKNNTSQEQNAVP